MLPIAESKEIADLLPVPLCVSILPRSRLSFLVTNTQIPLIFSGIFYACNTEFHIKYVDCLFLCVSSMCVTGLATVDLSSLSTFQQFLMYFQMLIGSLVSS